MKKKFLVIALIAALGVLLGMVAGVPDGLVVCPVNFLADLDRGPVDRDKVLLVVVLHENFLRSICLERRKPSWSAANGYRNPTTVPTEISPFRSAASRSKGS